MTVRMIHDKQASAAAATKTYVWMPRSGRRSALTAGVEFDLDDLDRLINALFKQREMLTRQLRQLKASQPDKHSADDIAIREITDERYKVRSLEYRLTLVRDDLKAEQRWRAYEATHPSHPNQAVHK